MNNGKKFHICQDANLGIRLQYPSYPNLIAQEHKDGISFSVASAENKEKRTENLDIIVLQSISKSLDEEADKTIIRHKESLDNFALVESTPSILKNGKLINSSYPAHRLVYTFDSEYAGQTKAMEIIAMIDNNDGNYNDSKSVVIFFYHAKPQCYATQLDVVNEIMSSFHLIPYKVRNLLTKTLDLGESGNYKEAVAAVDEVLDMEPDNALALGIKGTSLAHAGKYKEAIAFLNKSREISPTNSKIKEEQYATLYTLKIMEELEKP